MANVDNYFEQSASGSSDNKLNIDGTLAVGSNATFKIGGTQVTGLTTLAEKLNNLDSVEEVGNKTGGDLTAGTLVYISGYDATLDLPTVTEADADDATKKATLVLTEAIANNASGSAEPVATVTGLDTSAFSAVGSLVYESTTAGEFTHTAPTDANDDRRVVGVVKVKSATVGSIYFFPGKGGLEHAAVYLNNQTPGTAVANGAVILGASKEIATITTATITTGNIATVNAVNIDAGADAVKGTIDIFPTTTARGKTTIACEDNAGATTTNIKVEAQSGARVISIQDGGNATSNLLQSEGAQTINGVQTYTVPQVIDVNTGITAFAGGGQADATALTGEYNNVTTVASAYDSVKLLTAVAGQTQTIKNSGASILSVFPNTDDTINALAVNLSVDIPLGGEVTFTAISDIAWETKTSVSLSAPTTQTGGLKISASNNAANHEISITNASHGQATALTIPDGGSATANFVLSEGTATINGAKTFGSALTIPDITDNVKFLGLNDVLAYSTGTWTVTRVAQGDYVNRKTAGDETVIIGIDITEALRTTASKGLKLTSFDVIFRNTTADLDAHTVTLDKINYTDSAVVTTTSVALTGALGVGQDADPQIDNVVIDTPAFNVTDDSKYVMELTVDAAAASVYDFIGVMLKFTTNML